MAPVLLVIDSAKGESRSDITDFKKISYPMHPKVAKNHPRDFSFAAPSPVFTQPPAHLTRTPKLRLRTH